jgi:hypothetical protein
MKKFITSIKLAFFSLSSSEEVLPETYISGQTSNVAASAA